MRTSINKIKWLTVSVSTLSLVMVFWVWPAWNSGSQRWYFGNDSDSGVLGTISTSTTSTMYRNQHPPSGHNSDFVFLSSFGQQFMANEAAMRMLDFGKNGWNYHIEWYRTNGAMEATSAAVDLNWILDIGRWKNSMFESFHHVTGLSMGPGSMANPVIISGSTMSSCTPLSFERGDVLAAMLSLDSMTMSMIGDYFHVILDNTCYITSPLSDPGYPGAAAELPTLSQWGILLFAVIIAFLSLFAMRRRVRMSRH